jgi:hypothetical protein
MDPDKLNYQLMENVTIWIVAGEHSFPTTGSILVFLPGMPETSTPRDELMRHWEVCVDPTAFRTHY